MLHLKHQDHVLLMSSERNPLAFESVCHGIDLLRLVSPFVVLNTIDEAEMRNV